MNLWPARSRTGREPFAVVQLRQRTGPRRCEPRGFQTRLRIPEQQRVFRLIPGLEHGEFLRYGSITELLHQLAAGAHTSSRARDDPTLLFAGQLTGVEGYTESAATGMLAGINLAGCSAARRRSCRRPPHARRAVPLPARSRSGALPADEREFRVARAARAVVKDKARRREILIQRALGDRIVRDGDRRGPA